MLQNQHFPTTKLNQVSRRSQWFPVLKASSTSASTHLPPTSLSLLPQSSPSLPSLAALALWRFQNKLSIYSHIFPNIPKYSQIFPNILKYFAIHYWLLLGEQMHAWHLLRSHPGNIHCDGRRRCSRLHRFSKKSQRNPEKTSINPKKIIVMVVDAVLGYTSLFSHWRHYHSIAACYEMPCHSHWGYLSQKHTIPSYLIL